MPTLAWRAAGAHVCCMITLRHLLPACLALPLVLAAPAVAEEQGQATPLPDAPPHTQERPDILGEGIRRMMEGLAEDLRPQMQEFANKIGPTLEGFIDEMGPALNDLAEMIGDLNAYHPPERLPNGDIILRRKTPLPPPDDRNKGADRRGPIEL